MDERQFEYGVKSSHVIRITLPVILTLVTLLLLLPRQQVLAAGVVGDGTAGSCTEGALDAALAGGGNVTFYCGNAPHTITATSQKVITASTSIDGGDRIRLSGGHTTRAFYVNAGVALTLTNLTVSDGVVTGAGGYGGGVFNNGGKLNVINSTFSGNHADQDGGGIYTSGALNVLNSTFFSNIVGHAGGGIEIVDSLASVANSTFVSNTAVYGGGIDTYINVGALTLNVINSTFSGNGAFEGGGIRNNGGTITFKNTIVANNTSDNCSGTVTDGGGNLRWPNSDTTCVGTHGDPKLGSLADNGGPTWTMALLAGSAALDAGNDATCAASPLNNLDQRGSPRPVGVHCDVGAFEYDAPQTGPIFTVNSTGGTDDGVCGLANCRLREAIEAANTHAGADTIELAAGATYTLTMVDNFDPWYMGTGLPVIASDITVNAHGTTIARSQAAGTPLFRLFYVQTGGILRLNQATIHGGDVTDRYGGGIFITSGTLIATNSTFSNNTASTGGGINNFGTLTVINSTFYSNSAYAGGAIGNMGPATVINSTFHGNSSTYSGGITNGSTLTVINSTFSGNSGTGGGIYNWGTATLKNTLVADSLAGANCAGAIADGGGNLQFGGSTPNSCGVTIPSGDPQLRPLADNGGPTWTMALLYGSAALDAANDATCTAAPVNNLDQRGVSRPIGDHCDVGAYETSFVHGVYLPLILKNP